MPLFVAQKNPDVDHEHLIYVNNQTIECALANGHRHPVTADPQTGQIIVEPAKKHIHAAVPYTPEAYPNISSVLPDMSENIEADVVAEKADQFRQAYTAEEPSIDAGRESVRFRESDQWPAEVKNELAEKNRACLTINHIAPMVETLSGMYRRNRTDLRAFPTENGDTDIATVLTYAIKNVMQNNQSDQEEADVFEDAATAGRGVFDLYPEFDTDIRGNIRLRQSPWDQTVYGPHQRKDLEDCEFFFRWKWLSRDMIENLYPDKSEDVANLFGQFDQFIAGDNDLSDLYPLLTDGLFSDRKTRELRLLECEEKVYYRLNVYTDPRYGFAISDTELPTHLRSQAKSLKVLKTIVRKLHAIRKTVMAADVVLEDDYVNRPTAPYATGPAFSSYPLYAYKRGAHFEGKVERVKDAQREINKRRSQIIDILNTSITNGWMVPKGALGSQQALQEFKNSVSRPGFVVEVPDMQNVPQKIDGSRVEPAIVQLELNSTQSLRETANVNAEMMGVGNQYQSGSAMAHRLQQGLMGNEYLFDNMSQLKKRIGKQILLWIQELYTPERIARIFFDQAKLEKIYLAAQNPQMMNQPENEQQPVDPNDVNLYMQIVNRLRDADLTNYDVTIGETGQSPTAQLANFDMMMELAAKGVPIPPTVFIELAPIPNKERILQMLQQAQQQQADAEQKKYDTEITKTQIAAQSKRQG